MIDFHLKKSKRAPFAIFCSIGKLAEEGLVQSERGVAFQLLEISLKSRSFTRFLQYDNLFTAQADLGECRLGGEGHRALLQRNCVEAVEGCLKWSGRATCGGGTRSGSCYREYCCASQPCVEEEVLQMSPEQEGKTFHCRGA